MALQLLVAGDDALAAAQVLVVVVIEYVRGLGVQIHELGEILGGIWTFLGQIGSKLGVGVGDVHAEEPHQLAPHPANCVRTGERDEIRLI